MPHIRLSKDDTPLETASQTFDRGTGVGEEITYFVDANIKNERRWLIVGSVSAILIPFGAALTGWISGVAFTTGRPAPEIMYAIVMLAFTAGCMAVILGSLVDLYREVKSREEQIQNLIYRDEWKRKTSKEGGLLAGPSGGTEEDRGTASSVIRLKHKGKVK